MGQQDYSLTTQRVIAFVSQLTFASGPSAGTPFILRDWQLDILESIYGPVHDDGRRVVRTALITMPRKQGKTELAAALDKGIIADRFAEHDLKAKTASDTDLKHAASLLTHYDEKTTLKHYRRKAERVRPLQ